ncbi:MAG: DUF3072 domain-containing protein [Actinomycetota bacterium]|nr:DUF3072 domain-containing protein [Actinomycetota bacterium]
MPTDDRPTTKQQRYLRSLAQRTGTSFTPPATKAEASREIKRLKELSASPRHERRADREAVAKAQRGGEARVRPSEVTGYGSNATWR